MSKKCYLCKSSEDNELLFGKFYSKYKLTVHYYCLLLSSNLVQRGSNDTVGIFGFLESDIRKENERTKKCRCYICKNMHANVSCCSKKCLRTFHTACGVMNGCLSHYTDTYQSWCSAHVPLEPDRSPHSREEPCSICYDEMGQYDVITSIKAPCCRNGWFHQGCVAKYAQSAGYFFKCPLCNNEDKFLAEIPLRGVFVPERDAAWELEPNAFVEQLLRPTACDAADCKCQEGRSVDNRQWRLVVCGSCGSTCRHQQCMEPTVEGSRVYLCLLCRPILGERVALLENNNDTGDSSEDDTGSTSSSASLGRTLPDRARKNPSRAGSGESGVHCSSSDETLGNMRRLVSTERFLSDGSDSERSDESSIQIRRCIRQNTGKRVRRLMSDGSEMEKSSPTGRNSTPTQSDDLSGPDDLPGPDVCKRLEGHSTGALPVCHERSSPVRETDENSCSSSRSKFDVRSTRQLSRRLSSLSDSSKRSTSDSNMEEREPKRSITRRCRIYSSSDDSEKGSKCGKNDSHKDDDLPTSKERCSTRQRYSKPTSSTQIRKPRISTSSDDLEKKREVSSTSCNRPTEAMQNAKTVPETNSSCTQGTSVDPSQSLDISNSITNTRWDENSNMTGTVLSVGGRSSPVSEKSEHGNASDTSPEENIGTRRTRQLTRRLSPGEAGNRSTSESSMEIIRPKRIRAARISTLLDESDKRTEDSDNGTTDKLDFAPQNKRRRLTRDRCKKTNPSTTTKRHNSPSISPPSTPSSLASESSQPSAATHSNTSKTGSATLNLQQQSMEQFITFSARKSATTSDSSDQSMEEKISPSRWPQFGSSNKINSKISPISSGRTTTKTKRRRTHSDKKSNNRSHNEEEPETTPTSSKAAVQQRAQKGHIVHKDKGQKNILNYFSRY